MGNQKGHKHFDDILKKVHPCGKYQILVIIFTGIGAIPVGMFNLGNAFFAAIPVYCCAEDRNSSSSKYNVSTVDFSTCQQQYYVQHQNTSTDKCENEDSCTVWEFDKSVYKSTAASEWNLVCSSEWLLTLSQTTYMLGFLVGAVSFGAVSDKIGRKVTWIISIALMIVSGTLSAFMPNYWAFIGVRILAGVAAGGVFTTGFVLMMEILGGKFRIPVGIFYQGWFALGYMIMAIFGYFIRDFRHINLFISLFPLLIVPCFWYLDESPRWLMAEGKIQRASVILQKIARLNKSEYPENLINEESKRLLQASKLSSDEKENSTPSVTILDLFKTPTLRKNTLITCYFWFVTSLVYYGLSLGTRDLVGGPYINLFISGLVEMPSFVVAVLICDRIGRIQPMAWSLIMGGTFCLGMAMVPKDYQIVVSVFSMCGKFFVSASFALAYVYSAEIFPTVVRAVGIGSGSVCARIAALTAPSIALLGKAWAPLPYLVYASLTILGGFLTCFLPETLNQCLPETIEDGEQFGRNKRNIISTLLFVKCYKKYNQETTDNKSTSQDEVNL